MSVARKENEDYKIKDPERLLGIAHHLDVATTVEKDGEVLDRDFDEIALEVAEKALAEWGKPEGEILYAKRAPAASCMSAGRNWGLFPAISTGKLWRSCIGPTWALIRIIKTSSSSAPGPLLPTAGAVL